MLSKQWLNEPDELNFEVQGLPCKVIRHHEGKHLCGYVGVDRSHPLFGVDTGIPIKEGENTLFLNDLVTPHGGVTYARFDSADERWWLGFDCAHCGDYCPGFLSRCGTYRDIGYVEGEVRAMALQLTALKDRKFELECEEDYD